MKNLPCPVAERIPDRATASRCVDRVVQYLRVHESPLAAEDLRYAVDLLIKSRQV